MEKVTDIGGLFFRAQNLEKLALWFKEHLGVPTTPSDYAELPWMQEAGPTVIAPFPQKSDILGIWGKNGWSIFEFEISTRWLHNCKQPASLFKLTRQFIQTADLLASMILKAIR